MTIFRSRLALFALLSTVTACGQWRMVNTEERVLKHSRAGEYERALSTLQTRKYKSYKPEDAVLYWMNEGMLLHLVGRHREAITALSRAEQRAQVLFTRSVRKYAKAAFTSNAALDYQGEDHEKVLLNVVKSLSFLALGDRDGALVEARKINRKLEYMNTVYKGKGNAYSEDAFAHWLMGMLFEMEGSHDDARIAFANAYRVYTDQFGKRYGTSTPDYVAEDLARAAVRTGENEMLARLRAQRKDPGLGRSAMASRTHGEIVLVHLSGEGPKKTDFDVTCTFKGTIPTGCDHAPGGAHLVPRALTKGSGQNSVTVAFPKLVTREPAFDRITVRAAGQRAHSQVALPINRIARETLRDKLPRVFKSAVIRAVAKASSRKAAERANKKLKGRGKGGWLLGFALEVGTDTATSWSEEADKRAWSTLPARIEVARLQLPAGTHDVTLALPNGHSKTLRGVRISAGERMFLTHRTIR